MNPLDAIGRAQDTRLVYKGGDVVEFELAPALPSVDIDGLADELGVPLSAADVRDEMASELVALCGGGVNG